MGQGQAGESEFFALLAALQNFRAGPLDGDPSDRALARTAGVSPTTIGNWLGGGRFPQDIDKFLPVVRAVAARAAARGITGVGLGMAALLDEEGWRAAYYKEAAQRAENIAQAVEGAQAARALAQLAAGRLLTEVSDPFALRCTGRFSLRTLFQGCRWLPGDVPRYDDRQPAEPGRAAAEGSSGIAMMVGGSSTGKTRACWEVLRCCGTCPGRGGCGIR